MKPVPFAMKRCDLAGCELQAHGQLADGRYICDKHMLFFGVGAKLAEREQERLENLDARDVLEELEEGKFLPGDEGADGLKPQE